MFTEQQKQSLKPQLVILLETEREVCRVVIFGSFLSSHDPHDVDVAVFQDSDEKYLPLAMKYRRKTHDIARSIPLDNLSLKAGGQGGVFMDELEQGEVIYERRN